MATIGKIRKRSGLLLIVVGGAMAAFILGDLFSSGTRGQVQLEVGEIAGNPVNIQEYEMRVDRQLEILKSTNQPVDDNTRKQIRNQVWSDIIRERVFLPQIDQLGIRVTPEEYDDIRFGNNVLPSFRNDQNFINPETGIFDPSRVRQYFLYIQDTYPQAWQNQRARILQTRLATKYNNLLKKGIFINSVQAREAYVAQNKTVDFDFVVQPFAETPDSTVNVTEDDIRAYYDKHKNDPQYKQVEGRSIEYIIFEVKPSEEDLKSMEFELNTLKKQFAETTDDSLFVVENSDVRFYVPQVYTEGTTEAPTDSLIMNSPVGTVIGPYKTATQMKISKVVFNGREDEINARHILLQGGDSELMLKLADSLKQVIAAQDNFAAMARRYSQDQGSAQKGGDLGWFGKGRMVKPFEEASYAAKKGEMTIAKSQFGVHLIEVMDRRPTDKVKIASIARALEPSNQTVNGVYDRASELSINHDTSEKLREAADEQGLQLRTVPNLEPNAGFIPGLRQPERLIRWAFNAETDEVSEPLELDNNFVVATVTAINEEGAPTFEKVKDRMEVEVAKMKKAEMYRGKMSGNNLTTIANNIGKEVKTAAGVSFSSTVIPNGGGREPEVIAKAMTLPQNAVSVPIIGELGVYVIEVKAVKEAGENAPLTAQRDNLKSQVVTRIDASAYQALIEQAEVKDKRYKFF